MGAWVSFGWGGAVGGAGFLASGSVERVKGVRFEDGCFWRKVVYRETNLPHLRHVLLTATGYSVQRAIPYRQYTVRLTVVYGVVVDTTRHLLDTRDALHTRALL